MGKIRRQIVGRRLVASVLLVSLLCAVLAAVGVGAADAQTVSDTAEAPSSVRIAARKLANGNVEFGLQVAGGDRWLPRARFFPYTTVEVGRWLRASPYAMSDGRDVRIRARKLVNGKVEFALQVGADRQWLPATRIFPYRTATVGRWLYASWYTVGDPTTPLGAGSPTTTTGVGPTDRSSCTFERTMAAIVPSVFQVVVTTGTGTGIGTAFYLGNDEFLTAAHVIEGARTIQLQNHERTLRQVSVVGVDEPSDVAILRAEGAGIPVMRFGDESALGQGARIAVVGYPLFETVGAATIVSGLLSSKLNDPDHDYVSYLQTDAAANPGNSGGPAITACGEVIGLIVAKIVDEAVEGVSYAVSGTTVRNVLPRVRDQQPAPTPSSSQTDAIAYLDSLRLDAIEFLERLVDILEDSSAGTASIAVTTDRLLALFEDMTSYTDDLDEIFSASLDSSHPLSGSSESCIDSARLFALAIGSDTLAVGELTLHGMRGGTFSYVPRVVTTHTVNAGEHLDEAIREYGECASGR